MTRAGIFIGVDKTGGLQRLNDAAAGATRMREWAILQGMIKDKQAILITDKDGAKVYPDQIYDSVKQLLEGPGLDQLVVYFAGHGVNLNRCEHWLLTEAPIRSSAAINVTGSVELARYCGIGHVVIISDACRVAPDGIQAQNVRGQDIFPNDGIADRSKPVDQFFACQLGKPAAEVKDPQVAASNFSALYTDTLLSALLGEREEILEPSGIADDRSHYVKPAKLAAYLENEIPRKIARLKLSTRLNQSPDAILISHPHWISKIEAERLPPRAPMRSPRREAHPLTPAGTLRAVARKLVGAATQGDESKLAHEILKARTLLPEGSADLLGSVAQLSMPVGQEVPGWNCGITIQGTRATKAYGREADTEILNDGALIQVRQRSARASSIVVGFRDGTGTIIPVIPGYFAGLTLDGEELIALAYEPTVHNVRWKDYQQRASDIRTLRAVVAAVSRHGEFHLNDADPMTLTRRMQYSNSIDPSLSVYAAYAFNDLAATDSIRALSQTFKNDIGANLFDLALLGRNLLGKSVDCDSELVPCSPLMSRGWSLLGAHRVRLSNRLRGLETTLKESLWSVYDQRGVEQLEAALASGDIR